MKDDKNSVGNNLSTAPENSISQIGDKNIQVAHANNLTIHNYIMLGNFLLENIKRSLPDISKVSTDFERDYYSLIVTSYDISNGKTSISTDRVLCYDKEMDRLLRDLSESSRERIKKIPALIMNENTMRAEKPTRGRLVI